MSSNTRKQYVMGLVFNRAINEVLLIEKNRPEFLAGKLNGLGGKIEERETPTEALTREVEEEAGIRIYHNSWTPTGRISDDSFFVHVYCVTIDDLTKAKTLTDEEVRIISVNDPEIENRGAQFLDQIIHSAVATLKTLNRR